jgi:hypothetical protein
MKRLVAFVTLGMLACGGASSAVGGSDPTDPDAGLDNVQEPTVDSGASDGGQGATSDATADADAGTDASQGSLEAGATCDPNASQCAAGLTCCGAPNHPPPGSHYFCYAAPSTGCPAFP